MGICKEIWKEIPTNQVSVFQNPLLHYANLKAELKGDIKQK